MHLQPNILSELRCNHGDNNVLYFAVVFATAAYVHTINWFGSNAHHCMTLAANVQNNSLR